MTRVLFAHVSEDEHADLSAALVPSGYDDAGLMLDDHEIRRACVDRLADLFVVGRAGGDETALSLIRWLAQEGSCPVVAALPEADPEFVGAAADAGVFAFVVGPAGRDWQAGLALAQARHGQYRGLQDAFARRALVERAKGILMERQGIEEEQAFRLLRDHARNHSRRVAEVAESVLESHRLLPPPTA